MLFYIFEVFDFFLENVCATSSHRGRRHPCHAAQWQSTRLLKNWYGKFRFPRVNGQAGGRGLLWRARLACA